MDYKSTWNLESIPADKLATQLSRISEEDLKGERGRRNRAKVKSPGSPKPKMVTCPRCQMIVSSRALRRSCLGGHKLPSKS